jgi:ribonuclease G
MKGRVIALDQMDGAQAAALVVNGRLHDFLIDQDTTTPRPGTIFRAKADRPMKGQGAMLMALPGGQSGFLREAAGLKPGQTAMVQVTGYAEDGKAVPVTAKVLFKGRYCIVTPDAPGLNLSRAIKDEAERERLTTVARAALGANTVGLIIRSAAEGALDSDIQDDINRQLQAAQFLTSPDSLVAAGPGAWDLALREWQADDIDREPGSFERHNVRDLLVPFASPRFDLSGGAFAFVEPTRALVAVDVNTGADTSPAAGLKANLALARELSHQLLVRGLGGQITIDFAPLAKKDRQAVESTLRTALKADPIETALVGWTALGHYELQRKRERLPVNFGALA